MNTDDLDLFVRTADSGSITRAAEQLEMSTAAASAALKRLEKALGVQLFIRSTRQLRITAEGERFLLYCREALDQLETGRASLRTLKGEVAGELRVSASSDLGRNRLLGWIDEIMDRHPGLSIHLTLGDSLSDFYSERVDLAVRYGPLEESSMVAFKLATTEAVVCAAPSYLEAFGTPEHPADLKRHNCLLYEWNGRPHNQWTFTAGEGDERGRHKVRVSGNRCSNDSDAVRRWAVAGRGVVYKSRLEMADDLRAGRVVALLPEYRPPRVDLNLICPSRRQVTPAVLLLRDFFREKVSLLLKV